MERPVLLISVGLACILVAGSASAVFATAALTWNSFAWTEAIYDPSGGSGASDVISRFTPDKEIVVTRLEVQASQGPQRLLFSPTFQAVACTNPVAFKITDGTTTFTLPLPSATTVVTGKPNPSSADSGPLKIAFPTGAKIVLSMVPGDATDPISGATACFFNNANITVQYKVVADQD